MKKDSAKSKKLTDLRERAEEILRRETEGLQKISDKDVQSMVHELQVHQIELEMQNEELRRAQIELEESRNRYSDLYDFAPIGYFTFDKNGLILEVNLTGANKLGVERSFLIKKPFSLYIVPEGKDVFYLHLRQVFKTKTQQTCEIKLRSKYGIQFDAQLESQLVQDSEGRSSQCRTAINEITERKRAEKKLKLSEEKYRELANSISEPFFALNKDLRFTYWNCTSEKNTGISNISIIGKYLFDVFPELKRTQLERAYNEAIATGKVQFLENNRWDQKGGVVTFHDVSIYPTADGIAVFSRDVTERKKLEELVLENERLISANRARSEFMTIMSHELRTPLTSVIGYSIIMKEMTHGKLNEKQGFYMDNILASSKHLLDIINDVLDIARIEAGKLELLVESVPLSETISEVLNPMSEMAKMKKIILKKELDPQITHIEADRQKFKQILFNLISNAMKFSKEDGGIIMISAKKDGDMAKISVSDTGIGIREEDIPKLFQKFEQLDSGLSRKYDGAGLGLAITKQLVELHGGNIIVKSRYGEGSNFTFFLPVESKSKEQKKK